MKKQNNTSKKTAETNTLDWKNRREMISSAIPLEVDLENRQIFFEPGTAEKHRFDFGTNNVDNVIKTYLDPKDLKNVTRSLTEAKKGLEKPIPFSFTHPITSKKFRFEFRYQIVYVKYASTRLHGELIKLSDQKPKNPGKKNKDLNSEN